MVESWQEDVLECLKAYKLAVDCSDEESSEDRAAVLGDHLTELTESHREVFRDMPPETHARIWEAIYIGQNLYFDRLGCSNDIFVAAFNAFESLLTGRTPRLWQLTNWVGHGFGHDGTRANLS